MKPATKEPTPVTPTRDPWMSLNEACEALGTHREKVLIRVLSGELEAQIVAGRAVIARASVERARAAATSPSDPTPEAIPA